MVRRLCNYPPHTVQAVFFTQWRQMGPTGNDVMLESEMAMRRSLAERRMLARVIRVSSCVRVSLSLENM